MYVHGCAFDPCFLWSAVLCGQATVRIRRAKCLHVVPPQHMSLARPLSSFSKASESSPGFSRPSPSLVFPCSSQSSMKHQPHIRPLAGARTTCSARPPTPQGGLCCPRVETGKRQGGSILHGEAPRAVLRFGAPASGRLVSGGWRRPSRPWQGNGKAAARQCQWRPSAHQQL